MAKKAEYYYNEKTGLYRKRVKNPLTGEWQGVSSKTLPGLYEKIRAIEASWADGVRAKEQPLVAEYCLSWYELNTAELSDKGREGYSASINLHICPVLGNMRVADVTSDDVRRVLAVMQRKGLSAATQSRALRLMRRIVRDYRHRSADAEFTFFLWQGVRENEEKAIFPFRHLCREQIDSTLPYEVGMLKPYLFPLLNAYRQDALFYDEAKALQKKLDNVQPIPAAYLTKNSLYKEFI